MWWWILGGWFLDGGNELQMGRSWTLTMSNCASAQNAALPHIGQE
jgi:hypothetical protein